MCTLPPVILILVSLLNTAVKAMSIFENSSTVLMLKWLPKRFVFLKNIHLKDRKQAETALRNNKYDVYLFR
jgi:hypothetical protein